MTENIPIRIASSLLNSLKGGVVPRVGLPYISVGRKDEINSLLLDMDTIKDGGSSFRFIVGNYGSGKSFLLQMMKSYALDSNFVVVDCDLSPSRRFYGANGQGLATYKELIKNLSTKTKPEGGALPLVLQKWLNSLMIEVMKETCIAKDDPEFYHLMEVKVNEKIASIIDDVNGFDFAKLMMKYFKAFYEEDSIMLQNIYRFIRGEYRLKSEAKADLGISNIINENNWYDYLKLVSDICYIAGYSGTLVLIDELVNIYKIPNSQTRQQNYEMILMIYNEALQGKAKRIGFIMSGTTESIEDKRRGLYSYDALKSRLDTSRFTSDQIRDILAPVIKLKPLSIDEMLVLLKKLVIIHAKLNQYETKLSTKDLARFIELEYARAGANTLITPREIIRDFIEVLNILAQYPDKSIADVIKDPSFKHAQAIEDWSDFQEFEL